MKKIYYQLSDNLDLSNVIMTLEDCKNWIEADMDGMTEGDDKREYTITPIWMTEDDYYNLPEADI